MAVVCEMGKNVCGDRLGDEQIPHAHTHTHTHTERVNLDDARDDTSDNAFGSNPDPINYGLEAGDIVFAFFGSVLLVILAPSSYWGSSFILSSLHNSECVCVCVCACLCVSVRVCVLVCV